MNLLIWIKESLKPPIFGQAIGSLATVALFYLTLKSLRQYKEKEEKIENREIIEKIITPLRKSLEIEIKPQLLRIRGREKIYWFKWNEIKRENPYFIFRISPFLKSQIEDFCKKLEEFSNSLIKWVPHLKKLISQEIIATLINLGERKEEIIDKNFEDSLYSWKVNNDVKWIYFDTLLFYKKNLAKYLEESKKYPYSEILDEKFEVRGEKNGNVIYTKTLGRNEFEKYLPPINRKN
jgi:hypothetical protein